MSRQHRHRYAAVLPCGLPAWLVETLREVLSAKLQPRDALRPAQIHQVSSRSQGQGRNNAGSSRAPLRHRSPDPRHLAVLTHPGFVRAAPTLAGITRVRLPSASLSCCDRTTVQASHLHTEHNASRRNHRI